MEIDKKLTEGKRFVDEANNVETIEGKHVLTGIGYYAFEYYTQLNDFNAANVTLYEIDGVTYGSYVLDPYSKEKDYFRCHIDEMNDCMCQIKFNTPIDILVKIVNHSDGSTRVEFIDTFNNKNLLVMENLYEEYDGNGGHYTSMFNEATPFNCSAIEDMFLNNNYIKKNTSSDMSQDSESVSSEYFKDVFDRK